MHNGEVNILTLANALKLGFTVWSLNAGTYKIDSSTLKSKDGWQKRLDVPQEVRFLKSKTKIAQRGDKFAKAHIPLSESLLLSEDMTENNKVVGGGI